MKKCFVVLLVLTLLATFPSACGTLELGLETPTDPGSPTTSQIGAAAQTPQSVPTSPGEPEHSTPSSDATEVIPSTPTPEPAPHDSSPDTLRVAYVDSDGNVFLWSEGEGAQALTNWGGASRVKLSDDGTIVAFERGGDLWMVRSDGSDERQLVSADELTQVGISLYRFVWVPGTHTVAFNTSIIMDHGLALSDDLHVVDAETTEQTVLLPAGEGGEFYISPDGSRIAVVSDDSAILLYNVASGDLRRIFTYTPVSTASEFLYYAQPVWSADSTSLRVAIPSPDPYADPPFASIFGLDPDRGPDRQLLMGTLEVARMGHADFSPDFTKVAYLQQAEGSMPGGPTDIALVSLDDGGLGESVAYYSQASQIYGWSSDSSYFAFATHTQQPTAMIGGPGVDPFPALSPENAAGYTDGAVIQVEWVDDTRYLFLARNPRGWDILLGEVFQPGVALVGFTPGQPPSFDFAY